MAMQRIEFKGSNGHLLAARLDLPAERVRHYALFAHCFTCGKDIIAASAIAQALTRHGIAVLRFDFTGLGASEGEFANTNFTSNIGDLAAAADFLRERYAAPALLVGHSLGGAAVLAAAGRIPEARAIATIGAPSDPAHVTGLFPEHLDRIRNDGEAEVRLAGKAFRITRQFLHDAQEHELDAAISKLNAAVLVMHSPQDRIVDIANATHIFGAAKHSRSFVSLDGADHLLTNKDDARYAADIVAVWSARYLGQA